MKRNLVGVDGSSRNPATRRVVAPSQRNPTWDQISPNKSSSFVEERHDRRDPAHIRRQLQRESQASSGGILCMLEELSPGFRARRTNSTMVVDVAFSTMMVDVALEKRATS